MDLGFLARGLAVGFAIAAPVGPIGVLCIRRTLADGQAAGLLSGLGAATADAFYGAVAAFGLTVVSGFLVSQQIWLRLIGGAFLCYLGGQTLLAAPPAGEAPARVAGLAGAYAGTLALTVTNPMTILSFAAVFAGLGLGAGGRDWTAAGLLVLGVFCGSALWWLLLSSGVRLVRRRVTPEHMRWINRLSGAVIFAFGLLALLSVVRG